ncbi:NAD(P)-dependent oxidoreductase [Sphingomonas sp. So64.6b]|uniref:NAD(P)-dependent oxidoreductase n=1 Tax=Sphingomonas sp. So64.6b TaxID=2997354 RepID=UPI0016033FB7|nr:NAD(P)-binding domain-containing protein [Sphingomonas sp. So64.6b]QNA82729.1 NAD(P)-dependent oxidoreductase [Sphingomonas sp. So64.6b]
MKMTDVTIIGLGSMGLTMAELMLGAGRSVTLWNRSADKATDLVARGAHFAPSPAAAIAASPVILICVFDYTAAQAILDADGAAAALDGRLLVNLGTGSPEDARDAEIFVAGHGGRYLDGAIQAAPSQMGQDDTPILVSGAATVFAEALPLLRVLAGSPMHLGERIDAAAFMDLATLSYVYGAFGGFLHGARIAESVDISVATFGRIVEQISPTFGAFFKHEAAVIESGDFAITESPLRISIPAVERILRTSEALGINTELPALVHEWLGRADRAGLANEELASLIKILRG